MGRRSKASIESVYRNILSKARRLAAERLANVVPDGTRLTPIDREATEAWRRQWRPISHRSPPEGGWDWPTIVEGQSNEVKAFDLAIWHNDQLCGLAIGRFTNASLRLDAIEGRPSNDHPLKGAILALALETAANAAQLGGRPELRLMEPAEGLIETYVSTFGFRVEHSRNDAIFCVRSV